MIRISWGLLTLALAGCAAGPDSVEDLRPVKFAVIAAPGIGADLAAEDALLEAVTLLSFDPDVDFTLVPGPLLSESDDPAYAREALVGALGSLAGPCYPAWGPDDGPELELLEALEQGLPGHGATVAYAGKRVRGLRPGVLDPAGGLPEGFDSAKALAVLVRGGAEPPGDASWALIVRAGQAGEEASLQTTPGGGLELTLPPLATPPHLFAVATWDGAELRVELHVAGDGPAPAPLSPLPLVRSP